MRLRRPPVVLALALGLSLAMQGCAPHRQVRYFQPTADQIGPDPNSYGEVVAPLHGLIAVQGDELAYGEVRGRSRRKINGADEGQAHRTISQVLRAAIKGVEVENRGYPGDTVASSLARWQGARPANLLILCVGFGDSAANTPLDQFGEDLGHAIQAAKAQGAAVFVVTPPQLADPLQEHQLSDYRERAKSIAVQNGAEVFDAAASMRRIGQAPVKTAAQPAQVYQAIAADMVPYIKVVRGAPS